MLWFAVWIQAGFWMVGYAVHTNAIVPLTCAKNRFVFCLVPGALLLFSSQKVPSQYYSCRGRNWLFPHIPSASVVLLKNSFLAFHSIKMTRNSTSATNSESRSITSLWWCAWSWLAIFCLTQIPFPIFNHISQLWFLGNIIDQFRACPGSNSNYSVPFLYNQPWLFTTLPGDPYLASAILSPSNPGQTVNIGSSDMYSDASHYDFGVMITIFWSKYCHFMSYITPRIWLFLVKLIVNISTITLEIWDHYYFPFSELGISEIGCSTSIDIYAACIHIIYLHHILCFAGRPMNIQIVGIDAVAPSQRGGTQSGRPG